MYVSPEDPREGKRHRPEATGGCMPSEHLMQPCWYYSWLTWILFVDAIRHNADVLTQFCRQWLHGTTSSLVGNTLKCQMRRRLRNDNLHVSPGSHLQVFCGRWLLSAPMPGATFGPLQALPSDAAPRQFWAALPRSGQTQAWTLFGISKPGVLQATVDDKCARSLAYQESCL